MDNSLAEERQKLESMLEPCELTKIVAELYPERKPSYVKVVASQWRRGVKHDRKIDTEVINRVKIQKRIDAERKKLIA